MQVSVRNMAGDVVEQIEIRDDVFGVPINRGLLHQAVVRQLANRRQGTADTKTRAEVKGTTKKVYRQKGTGNARHGSRKVNLWKGGGVTFGPHPRDYRQDMPKKQRRAALRCALSTKAGGELLVVLDDIGVAAPRTKDVVAMLRTLAIERSALFVLPEGSKDVVLSARNIPGIDTLPAHTLNTLAVMRHEYLIMPVSVIRQIEEQLGTNGHDRADEAAAVPAERNEVAEPTAAIPAATVPASDDTASEAPPEPAATEESER